MQAFVLFPKPALDQIPNHGNQFVQAGPLRRHFRLVANRDEQFPVLFDLKNEFILHALIAWLTN